MSHNLALTWFNRLKKSNDPDIKKIVDMVSYPAFTIPKWKNIDEAVIFIVINQMLSIKAADKICSNLYSKFNNSKNILNFCCETSDENGPIFGLSQRKRNTLKNWSDFIKSNTKYNLSRKDSQIKFLEELKTIKGFGQWSIDMLAIFYFGNPNIWPSNDMNIKKVSKMIFGTDNVNEIRLKINNYETIIALCFWEIIDKKLV